MAAMACTSAVSTASVSTPRQLGAVKATNSRGSNARTAALASSFQGQSLTSVTSGTSAKAGNGRRAVVVCKAADGQTVVIGLAADSGCGKSTFMRRLTSVFGGAASPPKGGNPDSNTLISDTTTVICLDDYHSLDRYGRKEAAVTALDPRANNFDLMYEQVKALKEGKSVEKPIYNHVTGLLDAPETIVPPKILVIEGLHPM